MMPMCLLLLVILRQPLQCKASINGVPGILCICTNEVQTRGKLYYVAVIIIKDAPSAIISPYSVYAIFREIVWGEKPRPY